MKNSIYTSVISYRICSGPFPKKMTRIRFFFFRDRNFVDFESQNKTNQQDLNNRNKKHQHNQIEATKMSFAQLSNIPVCIFTECFSL